MPFDMDNTKIVTEELDIFDYAKIVTDELDIFEFQKSIFRLNADFFSPVGVYPKNLKFQSLQDFFEEQKIQPSQWMAYAGPAGIGQYSLKRGRPAGVLAKFDVHFRNPTEDEMQWDFQNFGEQVLGPAVVEVPANEREKYKNHKIFKVWKEDHYFTGPPKIVKSLFLSRVFSGDIPKDISDLVRQVDEAAETGEMITAQGYQFLHSTDGKMKYLPFGKTEEYNPSKLNAFGFVEIENGRMIYYPKEDKSHPIDYTNTICD